jgi:drug/metabolite transporter (DMT)-like permease
MNRTVAQPPGEYSNVQEQKALRFARRGVFLALLSGLIFSVDGLLVKGATAYYPFNRADLLLLIPLVCAGLRDLCSALAISLLNWRSGRLSEVGRSLASKPGRSVLGGALIGALCGTGGYMIALHLAGPAYVLPITSLYPAVAAVLAVFVLRERIPLRAWTGLALCVGGAAAISYTPPEGQAGDLFFWGMAFAALAAVGWGIEGVWATSGMDFIEPVVALNIYYATSAFLYVGVLIPLACLALPPETNSFALLGNFLSGRGTLFVACAGLIGSLSYLCWYCSMNMTGVSRAMALNISYSLWGILLSFLFTDIHLTANLLCGAAIIFSGMFLVIGNPRDMLNLRNVC